MLRGKTAVVWVWLATLGGIVGECRADWLIEYTTGAWPNRVRRFSDQGVLLGEFAPEVSYTELLTSLTVGPDRTVYANCFDMGSMRLYKISPEGVWDRTWPPDYTYFLWSLNVAVGWDGLLYARTFKFAAEEMPGVYGFSPITGSTTGRILPLPSEEGWVAFAPDGRMLVSGTKGTQAYVRSSDQLSIVATGEVIPYAGLMRFNPSEDAVYMVGGSAIRRFEPGDTVGSVFFAAPPGRSIKDVHFADDGTFYALMWTNTAVELSHYETAGTFLGTLISQPSAYPSTTSMAYLPVPEPWSVAMLGGGVLALYGRRRACSGR